jgi:hypothetical protein
MIVARYLVEYTDHRVITILQGLRVRSPPRPASHGVVGAINRDRASSIIVVAIIQMDFIIFLRMADPTSIEAPFRDILIGIRLWEAGRKAHRRTRDLLGTGVVPSVVGFAFSKVAVWVTRLHGMVSERMIVARRLVENTDHRVVTILRGLRGRSPPSPASHGMVGAITRDRASSISVVAIKSRSSTYGGLISIDILLYF